jgi:PEP-CTERM motif
MQFKTLLSVAALLAATQAQALVITQWNFNASTLTASTGTGAASYVGGTTLNGFNAGSPGDTASTDFAWGITTFAAQGTGDKQRGAQFAFSTVGFNNLMFAFEQRHSNTAARESIVQVSVDNGGSFVDAQTFTANAGDTWFTRSVDLSSFAGASNNANLLIRVVASFTGESTQYDASRTTSTYGTSSTYRFDMVTLSGDVAPIPEPGTYALMLAGLGAVGFLARRRRAA